MTQWLVRRGLLATVPVASLVLAFGACSSGDAPEKAPEELPGGNAALSDGPELSATPAAAERLARLNRQFVRIPALPRLVDDLKLPPGGVPPKPVAASSKSPEPRAVVGKGDAARFVRHGDRVLAEVGDELKRGAMRSATVDVPMRADGYVRVQPDGSSIGIEFATRGAKGQVEIEVAEGTATYPNAAPDGGDVVLRVTADSVEDFVVLDKRPATARVDYVVNVTQVPGLRLVDNTLEFLDQQGDPQIRVRPPRVIDAVGVTHAARLELSGCAADTDGAPPWNRPVTSPGAAECAVSVTWNDTQVAYPAVVDPVWTTAGSLANARYHNSAVRLSTGFVLTCGGIGDLSIAIASCEQFNPAAAGGAGSWATSTAMGTPRSDFDLVALSSGRALAVGGNSIYTSELYSASAWAPSTGDYSTGWWNRQMPALSSDGAYVVMIDTDSTPYRLNTTTNAWSEGLTNPSPTPSYRYSAVTVPIPGQGTIMRVGGYSGSTYLTTGERYNPSTNTWLAAPPAMTVPRGDANVAVLDNNRVMIYGGYTGADYAQTAEIYSGSGNAWAFTNGSLPGRAYQSNHGSSAAFHGSGKMFSITDYTGPFIYDPAAASNAWSLIETYNYNFYTIGTNGNVVSAGSKVLLVPVQPSSGGSGAQTACQLFDLGEKGALCSQTAECKVGLTCVSDAYDGAKVCCDTACTSACSSCRAARKTSGIDEGTCGPRKATDYVGETSCAPSAQSSCGNTGYYCDGAGACAKWNNSTICVAGTCVDGDTQNNTRTCNGSGTCSAAATSECSTGYKCNGGGCQTECYNDTDYCASGYYCQTWTTPFYTCQPRKSDGASCDYSSECSNGFCVDGVCCNAACDGTCEACSSALTGQTNGTCKPISTSTDPQGDCADFGAESCGQNGLCNGAGACQLYANNTLCADIGLCASETVRYVADTCNGSGSCQDKGTANCATGYACLNGACNSQCTSDANCASNFWCDVANKVCVADRSSGQSCARDAVCTGNANCVDGVCCDSACAGSCRSCLKARTGLASDGVCGNTFDDTDPENECATGAAYPNSCAAPGLCNGAGACRPYAKLSVECDTDVCTDSTLTTYECNGAGTCKAKSVPCYPFKCDAAANACRVACSSDTHCVTGSSCENGTCVGQLEIGQGCTRGAQCKSTYCANIGEGWLIGQEPADNGEGGAGGAASEPPVVDDAYPGVCCDEDCRGLCRGCKKSIKGEGSDGVCGNVTDNSDPKDDCAVDPNNFCGHNGDCNGGGACRNTPTGTACGDTSCAGNSLLGQSCSEGNCLNNPGGIDCAPYVCGDVAGKFQCTNPCASDNDCRDGYYCAADQKCVKKLANGKACETSGLCDSGFCVDGQCCDASCNGQCEACDSPGSEGICTAVQGDPRGNRAQCEHAGEECGGSCDGVNAASCRYKANGEACGTATCTNAVAESSSCDGQGSCREGKAQQCSPFNCADDDTCLTLCQTDDDCTQGYNCDETTQRCLPAVVSAECSEDRQASVGQNGISTPCKPFLCVPASGTCAVSCASTTDCSPEFVCEPSTKTCLPAPPNSGTGEEEGCACRAAGAPSPGRTNYLALAALGLVLTSLRRRQRTHQSRTRAAKPTRFSGAQPSE